MRVSTLDSAPVWLRLEQHATSAMRIRVKNISFGDDACINVSKIATPLRGLWRSETCTVDCWLGSKKVKGREDCR